MTGVTFAHALVRPVVANVVALLAAVLGGNGWLHNGAVKGTGHKDHRQTAVLAAAELFVLSLVTTGAVAGGGMGGNGGVVVIGCVPISVFGFVTGHAVYFFIGVF